MPSPPLHRFERDGRRFALDPSTCFCFECDAISWDVLQHFPEATVSRTIHLLESKYNRHEVEEVIGELEWLRATKSILGTIKRTDENKEFEFERGLRQMTVLLPSESAPVETSKRGWFGKPARVLSGEARDVAARAVALLLNRSMTQRELLVEFVEQGEIIHAEIAAALCDEALRAATLAGKKLTAAIRISDPAGEWPAALDGHRIAFRFEFQGRDTISDRVRELGRLRGGSLSAWSKALTADAPGVSGRVIVQPGHPGFRDVVETLDQAGFKVIQLDLDGAFAAKPDLDAHAVNAALKQSAVYYANRLLENHYFRLDPIASLFWRIYEGQPRPRADLSGTHALAIDPAGNIFPSRPMLGNTAFKLGNVVDGEFDETATSAFEDVGSVTMAPCRACWARNLCGGGHSAVHHAMTGSIRTPSESWCTAQRAWIEDAIAAFNILSSHGVNFTRVYNTIGKGNRPGLFTMLRAAMKMTVLMRPLEESDAAMLVRWEFWAKAAYFLYTERGMLMATKYDREMDSLHPLGIEQEMILTRRDNTPIGLARIRPERIQGAAMLWLFMHDPRHYTEAAVQNGLKHLLEEAIKQQGIRRLTTPALERERELRAMLETIGFHQEGVQREAVFLDNAYHDVLFYGLTT